jgi:YbbR domain-containing protein
VPNLLGRLANNWQLKLLALALSFLFWAALRRDQPYTYTVPNVPIQVVNNDPEWVLAGPPDPATASVTFQGTGGDLLQIAAEAPQIMIPVEEVTDSTGLQVLRAGWVQFGQLPVRVTEIRPTTVRISFDHLGAKLLRLGFELSGAPAAGFELAGPPIIDPPAVRASGGMRRLTRLDSLTLHLNLDNRSGVDTLEVPIDTSGTGLIVSPQRVRVIVPLRPVADTLPADALLRP